MRAPRVAALGLWITAVLFQCIRAQSLPSGCHEYYSKGIRAPAVDSVTDTIVVPDSFPVGEATVTLDLSHRRIGALVVSLSAQPPEASGTQGALRTVVLKERGLGRLGDNMYMTSFSDASMASFPVDADAAPFRGSYKPTQRLSFLYEDAASGATTAGAGGSQGDWILRIDDVAPNSTIRPIALNGWMLRLCPRATSPTPVPTPPQQETTSKPIPAPSGVIGFEGPSAQQQQPSSNLFGWKVLVNKDDNNKNDATSAIPGGQGMNGTPQGSSSGTINDMMPPFTNSGGASGVPPINVADPFGILAFQTGFDSYLKGKFGALCTDDACSNIKAKFWKAALGIVYLKAAHDGKLGHGEIADKLAQLIPGPNPLLGKLSDAAKEWSTKKDDILAQVNVWYDKLLQYMAGNMDGLGALLTSAMSGDGANGLKSLGIDPNVAMSALGPMLGLDNPEDTKALMDGLSEAGFQDLMKEFLMPSRRRLA